MKKKFETKRLIIREFEDKDCVDLYEYASDAEVVKFCILKSMSHFQKQKKE